MSVTMREKREKEAEGKPGNGKEKKEKNKIWAMLSLDYAQRLNVLLWCANITRIM